MDAVLVYDHFHMPDKSCRLRRSMQHSLEVYPRECEILKSFWVVDSRAARPGRAVLENSRTGRSLGGSIAARADWYFHSCRVAKSFAGSELPPGCRRDRQRGDSQSRAMCQHAFIMKKKLPTPEDFAPLPKKSVLVEEHGFDKKIAQLLKTSSVGITRLSSRASAVLKSL